jgi:hypothetical protein
VPPAQTNDLFSVTDFAMICCAAVQKMTQVTTLFVRLLLKSGVVCVTDADDKLIDSKLCQKENTTRDVSFCG